MSRSRSWKTEIMVGSLLLLAATAFGWMAIQVGAVHDLGESVRVTAVFDDAAGLVPDSAVKIAGVEVGRVGAMALDGNRASVTLVLRKDAAVRSDVRAEIRARSLLGEKYVSLQPKSSEAALLTDGGRIAETGGSMEIEQLVAAIGPLLAEVSPDDVRKLVHGAALLSEEAGAEAPQIFDSARSILGKLEGLGDVVPAVQRDVPPTLAELRSTVGRLDATLDRLDRALDHGDAFLGRADEAIAGVPAVVAETRSILAEVRPAADDVAKALEASDEAVSEARAVLKSLSTLDDAAIRRLLREEGVLIRLKPLKPGEQ